MGQQQPQSHSPHKEEPQPDHTPRAKAANLWISPGIQASEKELKQAATLPILIISQPKHFFFFFFLAGVPGRSKAVQLSERPVKINR